MLWLIAVLTFMGLYGVAYEIKQLKEELERQHKEKEVTKWEIYELERRNANM